MPLQKKRTYNAANRNAQAALTRQRILESARQLFQTEGFECVTIEKMARAAEVSIPTIYSLFQSKRGVLFALMDEALPSKHFAALVEQSMLEKSPKQRLIVTAKLARQMYDSEREQIDIFHGASLLAPEFKKLQRELEQRRYIRQEEFVKIFIKDKTLAKGITLTQARDILWAFSGRDMYRMFVVERGWTSDEYEKWLALILIKTLLSVD